jgi:hypothetical protein
MVQYNLQCTLLFFRITQTIHEKALKQAKNPDQEKDEDQFSWPKGSHMDLEKVSLEFVKTVCKVWKLTNLVESESMVDGFKVTQKHVISLSNYLVERSTHLSSTDNSSF